jgi:hypothetical protein
MKKTAFLFLKQPFYPYFRAKSLIFNKLNFT